jgi:hypothetical protein
VHTLWFRVFNITFHNKLNYCSIGNEHATRDAAELEDAQKYDTTLKGTRTELAKQATASPHYHAETHWPTSNCYNFSPVASTTGQIDSAIRNGSY